MKNFSRYQFRSSQLHYLMTGTIGCTEKEEAKLKELQHRKKEGVKPLTSNMEIDLKNLLEKKKDKSLPKTMETKLREIHRAELYERNFLFTNKYVQKGLKEEEEAISLYMNYRNANNIRTFFTKNEEQFENFWISGTPDLVEKENGKIVEGWDTKCSWDLSTFPFAEDDLSNNYYWQNQGYMFLTGAKKWTTVSCLVNGSERLVNNEKQKWYYALDAPGEGERYFEEYRERCRDVEKMMIFDYDRFVHINPGHLMEISRDEWYGEGYDIPMEKRIIEKTVEFDPEAIELLKERIQIARLYLIKL